MKKKSGFTLVEVLGAIVILGLVFLLAIPSVINQVKKSSGKIDDATKDLIFSSAKLFIGNNTYEYPIINENIYCISLQTLINSGDLIGDLTNVITGKKVDLTTTVKVDIENQSNIDYSLVSKNKCVEVKKILPYIDETGAFKPNVDEGMIPIKWDLIQDKWVKANVYEKWYDYGTKEWANVVLVTEATRENYKTAEPGTEIIEADVLAYLVWIPRYRYKLFNVTTASIPAQTIEVSFETNTTYKVTGNTNGTWLTHPAFTFGDKELEGFWVGKFEMTGDATTPTVKPLIRALSYMNFSQFFAATRLFNDVKYGLTTENDAHMIKNMEWGAMAFLTHSVYGSGVEELWMNASSDFITGCSGPGPAGGYSSGCLYPYTTTTGLRASSTGNIYGIFDINGGSDEAVMGAMYNSDNTTVQVRNSGFDQTTIDSVAMSKYLDKYTYDTNRFSTAARRKLGDATGETIYWNGDSGDFVENLSPWFQRGDNSIGWAEGGAFAFSRIVGDSYQRISTRIVILGSN